MGNNDVCVVCLCFIMSQCPQVEFDVVIIQVSKYGCTVVNVSTQVEILYINITQDTSTTKGTVYRVYNDSGLHLTFDVLCNYLYLFYFVDSTLSHQ